MSKEIVIIGGGPGGYTAAIYASQMGAKVCLVERDRIGGTCLNRGCIPTKALVASASLLQKIRMAKNFGIEVEGVRPNIGDMFARKEKIVSLLRKGIEALIKRNRVEIIKGHATLTPDKEVVVRGEEGDRRMKGSHIIVAVGSRSRSLPHIDFDGKHILSSTDLLEMEKVPESIVIIGGGVIGCEFAYILSSLGCKVIILEALDRLLPIKSIDPMCSRLLLREFKKARIGVHLKTLVQRVVVKPGGGVQVVFSQGEGEEIKEIAAEKVALCVGRAPVLEIEEMEKVGISTYGGGWLEVDETLMTSRDDIYAIGDCLGPKRPMLAHVASHEAIAVVSSLLQGRGGVDYLNTPSVVYTEPEIGCVGLSEEMVRERGIPYECVSVLFRSLGRSHTSSDISGEAKLIFDTRDKKVLGIHIVGAHASELVATGGVLLKKNATITEIKHTIFAHPTFSEIFHEASLKALGTPLHG